MPAAELPLSFLTLALRPGLVSVSMCREPSSEESSLCRAGDRAASQDRALRAAGEGSGGGGASSLQGEMSFQELCSNERYRTVSGSCKGQGPHETDVSAKSFLGS